MQTETAYKYFRIIASGLSGSVATSPHNAWQSYYRAGRRTYGYRPEHEALSENAHGARLIEATTRRAAANADISAAEGLVGRGHWRLVAQA